MMVIAIRYQQYLGKQARSSHLTDVMLMDIMPFVALVLHVGHDLGDKSTKLLI